MAQIQHTWAVFWGLAGFMAGIAVAFFLFPLWQSNNQSALRRYRVIVSATTLFIVTAVVLYLLRGEPEAMNATIVQSTAPHGLSGSNDESTASDPNTAGSMEQAAARLALRLRDGGSDADWKLLKQSYEFLGDTEGASLAERHQVKPNLNAAASSNELSSGQPSSDSFSASITKKLAPYQQRVAVNKKDSDAWLAIAELNRSARNYSDANAAYEKVIALKKMTASSWADYADSFASQQKTLNNPQTLQALNAALKLEPNQLKALWLKASLFHETGKYDDALAGWQKLLTLVPNDSSDHQIIENNIEETQALLNNNRNAKSTTNNSTTNSNVSGSVMVDERIKSRISNDMVLFVFAKTDSPGPPAAVLRVPVKAWPMNFVLDDSLSMIASRKLSQFKTVNIQARLSRSGQAMPQPGDVQSEAVVTEVGTGKSIMLTLNKVIE